jgi:hypothetical protein
MKIRQMKGTCTMKVTATLTEIRADHMQKWERTELSVKDQARYIWLAPIESRPGLSVGTVAELEFVKGTGGAVGGHWAGWKIAR